jgi:hypothetical protein
VSKIVTVEAATYNRAEVSRRKIAVIDKSILPLDASLLG